MIIPYIYLKYLLYTIIFVGLPVFGLTLLKIFQKWTLGKCKSLVCLIGKTAIVTGGTSGIGFETALILASRGCRVIIADKDSGLRAKNKIVQTTNNTNIEVKYLDLASLKSVRKFAKEINENEERLDILINNAGVVSVGNKHTADGLHETMQINHFGPFLLTHLLADLLKKSAPSRIIFVSSAFSFFSNLSIENLNYPKDHPLSLFRTALIYGNSKLCNIIAANGFAQRLEDHGVTCNSLHPGWVNTKLMKNFEEFGLDGLEYIILSPAAYMYSKNPREGAQTTLHLAISNEVSNITGKHFWDCITFPLPPGARNEKFCNDIWEESENFVQLNENEKLTNKKLNDISNIEEKDVNVDSISEEKNENELVTKQSIENADENSNDVEQNDENIEKSRKDSITEKLGVSIDTTLFENGVDSASDEDSIKLDVEYDNEDNTSSENKVDGFIRFREPRKGEGFVEMNGKIEHSEAKERS